MALFKAGTALNLTWRGINVCTKPGTALPAGEVFEVPDEKADAFIAEFTGRILELERVDPEAVATASTPDTEAQPESAPAADAEATTEAAPSLAEVIASHESFKEALGDFVPSGAPTTEPNQGDAVPAS